MCLRPFIILTFLIINPLLHPSVAATDTSILKELKPGTITIIGETHQQIESVLLFQNLVTAYLKQNQCLTVGLEIASNQQPVINQFMQGRAAAASIEISEIIDHPLFRKMIDDLAALKRNGNCLKLVAIDAGKEIDANRDAWMALKLAEQAGDTPILVLLGDLHTLKRVDWDLSMTQPSPYVAEVLTSQGYQVNTYPQHWHTETCPMQRQDNSLFVRADQTEAATVLNDSLISLLNAFPVKTAKGIVNGVIVWLCCA